MEREKPVKIYHLVFIYLLCVFVEVQVLSSAPYNFPLFIGFP